MEFQSNSPGDWDAEQAIKALKQGTCLMKYGRKGKPKLCPFHLSEDETSLVWYVGKDKKQLKLSLVSRIIPGQRTAIFQRYPQPEKEYQSFSLIYGSRSLDLICKDKDEAEMWFSALRPLILQGNHRGRGSNTGKTTVSSKGPSSHGSKEKKPAPVPSVKPLMNRWTKAFSDIISLTATKKRYTSRSDNNLISIVSTKNYDRSQGWDFTVSGNPDGRNSEVSAEQGGQESPQSDTRTSYDASVSNNQSGCSSSVSNNPNVISNSLRRWSSLVSDHLDGYSSVMSDYPSGRISALSDNMDGHSSAAGGSWISSSSAVSSSSYSSPLVPSDASVDVFIWGEGIEDGFLGGRAQKFGCCSTGCVDALLPKAVESRHVHDARAIACGSDHAVLVTKEGQLFSWGDSSGGRLGHGIEADISQPKLIDAFSGFNIELVACGEYHTCAVTLSGDLYTWGDGIHNLGILGHGTDVSNWIPKKVCGDIDGVSVSSISCGTWHTAAVTSDGRLFTFGDGSFGALGHGDCNGTYIPREVESLKGQRTLRAACGVWHTAAIVEGATETSSSAPATGNLFTWGNGDKGQLGHGDRGTRLVPSCVAVSEDISFRQVACGNSMTIALTASGQVYTMGSTDYGQLGSPDSSGKFPTCIRDNLENSHIEKIACGSYHVAVLSSNSEVYTWGKGGNGQLGHGDNSHRNVPTFVEALKYKQVKTLACGSNFTAAICLRKCVSNVDHSICSGCHNQFSFKRKRRNCYNCGLAFCHACSGKKSTGAALAPNAKRLYRVCDNCFTKLRKDTESALPNQLLRGANNWSAEKETPPRPKRQLPRICSFDSFRETGNQHPRWSFESSRSESSSELGDSNKISTSSSWSQTRSSFSRKSCPTGSVGRISAPEKIESPEVVLEDSNHSSENCIRETSLLRAQVEDLLCKSQLLEAELKRMYRQLKEATEMTEEEAEENKAAEEVIQSLTSQLNSVAERVDKKPDQCKLSRSPIDSASGYWILSPSLGRFELS